MDGSLACSTCSFTRGLELDIEAVMAALTMPFHNGHIEGVHYKTR